MKAILIIVSAIFFSGHSFAEEKKEPLKLTAYQFKPGLYSNGECTYRITQLPNVNVLVVFDAGCRGNVINSITVQKAYCDADVPSCSTSQFVSRGMRWYYELIALQDGTIAMYESFSSLSDQTNYVSSAKYILRPLKGL